jgi:hypothetical protein
MSSGQELPEWSSRSLSELVHQCRVPLCHLANSLWGNVRHVKIYSSEARLNIWEDDLTGFQNNQSRASLDRHLPKASLMEAAVWATLGQIKSAGKRGA